jgi:hypothetical protein
MTMIQVTRQLPLLLLWSVSAASPSHAANPKRAPAQFATAQYGLTFHVPDGATYCPLPKDWVGSDHGTVIFLKRPKSCGGAGYPSSGRGFDPAETPRFELFYAYWMGEDEPPEEPCHRIGHVTFLGKDRPICETRDGDVITRTVSARYFSDIEAKVYFSVVTNAERLSADVRAFRAAATTFRTCSAIWHDSSHKTKDFKTGHGPLCPQAARWF